MEKAILVGLLTAVVTGTAIALQAPINNALTRHIGLLETAFVCLFAGAVVSGLTLARFGRGNIGKVTETPALGFTSGVLGIVILTGIVVTISRLGVTRGLAAILVIQFTVLGAIEHYGFFGVDRHPFSYWTIVGISLIALGAVVIRQ